MESIISCQNLTKRYGKLTAVDDLSLQVGRGEVFGFLGPNGAGKSTTLRILVGLIKPTSGSATIFGKDCWNRHVSAMNKTGALIEIPAFYKYLSGRDNLRIFANCGRNTSLSKIDFALEAVGLMSRARDRVKNYSQGMRQRLGIALAIVDNPELVLLDEPTNGLDPAGLKEVRDLIRRLTREYGITTFLSSHLLHEVEQTCDRIAVVNKGKVIETGKVSELLGGRGKYRLAVDNSARAHEIIDSIPWASVANHKDGELVVSLESNNSAELNKILVASSIAVSELSPISTSLEELYLQLMDESQ